MTTLTVRDRYDATKPRLLAMLDDMERAGRVHSTVYLAPGAETSPTLANVGDIREAVRALGDPDTGAAGRLAHELRQLGRDFVPLWDATNIPQGREGVEERFAKLVGLYEQEARAITPWDGGWGPARRMQTGPHPM